MFNLLPAPEEKRACNPQANKRNRRRLGNRDELQTIKIAFPGIAAKGIVHRAPVDGDIAVAIGRHIGKFDVRCS